MGGVVKIVNLKTGKSIHTINHGTGLTNVTFNDVEMSFVTSGSDRVCRAWNFGDGFSLLGCTHYDTSPASLVTICDGDLYVMSSESFRRWGLDPVDVKGNCEASRWGTPGDLFVDYEKRDCVCVSIDENHLNIHSFEIDSIKPTAVPDTVRHPPPKTAISEDPPRTAMNRAIADGRRKMNALLPSRQPPFATDQNQDFGVMGVAMGRKKVPVVSNEPPENLPFSGMSAAGNVGATVPRNMHQPLSPVMNRKPAVPPLPIREPTLPPQYNTNKDNGSEPVNEDPFKVDELKAMLPPSRFEHSPASYERKNEYESNQSNPNNNDLRHYQQRNNPNQYNQQPSENNEQNSARKSISPPPIHPSESKQAMMRQNDGLPSARARTPGISARRARSPAEQTPQRERGVQRSQSERGKNVRPSLSSRGSSPQRRPSIHDLMPESSSRARTPDVRSNDGVGVMDADATPLRQPHHHAHNLPPKPAFAAVPDNKLPQGRSQRSMMDQPMKPPLENHSLGIEPNEFLPSNSTPLSGVVHSTLDYLNSKSSDFDSVIGIRSKNLQLAYSFWKKLDFSGLDDVFSNSDDNTLVIDFVKQNILPSVSKVNFGHGNIIIGILLKASSCSYEDHMMVILRAFNGIFSNFRQFVLDKLRSANMVAVGGYGVNIADEERSDVC
eukprot:TRINITY_DN7180_c0_g2_i2.p1 TRINITY_DN7180_c0_g2~~TRINITY_DN7180_c0_g2_i2.p1  ORF type:complete len:683 (+),score=162.48 TRINITY_DN7180_c0_g2_i2:53-2050(+)